MKKYLKVSLKQLKQELSFVAAEAASGTTVEITRYNKPFLRLLSSEKNGLFTGSKFGNFTLKPLDGVKTPRAKDSIVAQLLKDRT